MFTSGGDGTKRCKGMSAIPASKSGPALAASDLVSKRFVVYLASVLGVSLNSFYLEDDLSAGLQSDRRLVWQKLQRLGTVDDKVFERYPPKKDKKGDGDEESREESEDEDDARDGEDGGVEYEDVAHLQPSDGE